MGESKKQQKRLNSWWDFCHRYPQPTAVYALLWSYPTTLFAQDINHRRTTFSCTYIYTYTHTLCICIYMYIPDRWANNASSYHPCPDVGSLSCGTAATAAAAAIPYSHPPATAARACSIPRGREWVIEFDSWTNIVISPSTPFPFRCVLLPPPAHRPLLCSQTEGCA